MCIGIGTGSLYSSYTWGEQSYEKSIEALKTAFDLEVKLIDTGETYGAGLAEKLIGKVIKERGKKVAIATKVDLKNFEDIETSCNESLRRLNVDCIDLYQIHWLPSNLNIEDIIYQLLKLKEKGKVRNLGVCNCGEQSAVHFDANFVTNQLPYSPIWREVENRKSKYKNNWIYLWYSCLGQGLLSGKYKNIYEFPNSRKRTRLFNYMKYKAKHNEQGYEELLNNIIQNMQYLCKEYCVECYCAIIQWIIYKQPNSIPIIGIRSKEQLYSLYKSLVENKVNIELMEKIDDITNPLKTVMEGKFDPWDSKERII
ncbi:MULTISPECIES: aldo/keto reductase [Blautia]|uniref:aldo/keto reductase n=1 Tax=Blautia TaxID=572511 RepID=UPI0013903D2F|nr:MULTISPECIES: aldo/keto reductase [Blautia]